MDKRLEDHFLDTLSLCKTVAAREKRQCILHISMDNGEAAMAFAGTQDDIIDSLLSVMLNNEDMRDIILTAASEYIQEAQLIYNEN